MMLDYGIVGPGCEGFIKQPGVSCSSSKGVSMGSFQEMCNYTDFKNGTKSLGICAQSDTKFLDCNHLCDIIYNKVFGSEWVTPFKEVAYASCMRECCSAPSQDLTRFENSFTNGPGYYKRCASECDDSIYKRYIYVPKSICRQTKDSYLPFRC